MSLINPSKQDANPVKECFNAILKNCHCDADYIIKMSKNGQVNIRGKHPGMHKLNQLADRLEVLAKNGVIQCQSFMLGVVSKKNVALVNAFSITCINLKKLLEETNVRRSYLQTSLGFFTPTLSDNTKVTSQEQPRLR